MTSVDLNADVGEGFGVYAFGSDAELLELVSSANIACGFHAGDPTTMRETVRLALERGVAIGAHPGLPDRLGFGRRNMDVSPREVADLVIYQVSALTGFVRAAGGVLRHVKPHGALYNMAAQNPDLAQAIATAVHQVDPDLILVGLAGSALIEAGEAIGLQTASEAFADRTYQDDGSLTPRAMPEAVIVDEEQACRQAIGLVKSGCVCSLQGTNVEVLCDTLCIHGDTPGAVRLARLLRQRLAASGIAVVPMATRVS